MEVFNKQNVLVLPTTLQQSYGALIISL